jgi:hypothetical protein
MYSWEMGVDNASMELSEVAQFIRDNSNFEILAIRECPMKPLKDCTKYTSSVEDVDQLEEKFRKKFSEGRVVLNTEESKKDLSAYLFLYLIQFMMIFISCCKYIFEL